VGEREVDSRIALLELPTGAGPDVRERARAAEWLLEHADRAHPELLSRVSAGRAGPAAIELLGRMGREDAVAPLTALLDEEGARGHAAARALAAHPSAAALTALRDGLGRGGERAVLSADGLGTRGDTAACPDLLAAAEDTDPRVRYRALQGAAALGCAPAPQLAERAAGDADADVRELGARLASG
jgi:HEAT repeat protein